MTIQNTLIGREFDDYKIEHLLGEGGMGVVYKGWDKNLGRHVAIKVLANQLVEDFEAVKRFEREAHVIAELNHPNIAQVYRIGKIDGVPYYSMEFIDGCSLHDILQQTGRISGSKFAKIAIQAAEGLKAAAAKNIIHRDIKPANIMIMNDDSVKIVDFGIAKAFTGNSFKTATGMLLGTPLYMSPEQGRGAYIDHRADIYSLGATFFQMVTGKPPFEADNPINLIQKHIQEPVKNIKEINPNVPDKLCVLIYGMLQKNPADRISDYNEIIIALKNISGEKTAILSYTVVDEKSPFAPDEKDKKKLKMIILVIAAVIIFILALSALFKSPAPVKDNKTEEVAEETDESAGSEKKEDSDSLKNTLKGLDEYQKELRKEKSEKNKNE